MHYAIGNGEIELPESKEIFLKQKELHPKQDNLFMRYMKQAMGVIKKAPHDDSNLDKVSIDKDNQEVKGATVDVKKKYVLSDKRPHTAGCRTFAGFVRRP